MDAAAAVSVPSDEQLAALEQLCVEFAVIAGRFIRDERPDRLGVAQTKSTDTDVVTVMDRRSEELLHRLIIEARPDDGILGEEGADVTGTSGLTWVIDPIDGTVNYLYEIPAYAVSVAVVVGDPSREGAWRPVAGAISDPSLRLVHHARHGAGAWTRPEEEGDATPPRRLTVSSEHRLGRSLLATGFGYAADVRARQAEVLTRVLPLVRDIRRIGSAALDLVRVADGSVDAYAESGINAWDLAAGWIVVEEAGGVVVGRDGGAPGKALTVAAGPALATQVAPLFTTEPA
ncbi:myo-inositol-1(or 4)-monophosphatase [Humibacillus xanthopallidus]|uniref:inositol-phosphate phosphatase n=1 Tax=Humibacillus xanthopallidus TaxID=412689 RepID=A0A543PU61_9MICO|nr:inositol monophosphatase family protein [Humibacillus xanthopallidus]TQN47609.1 myo-inositol-1(or 4)-monophosphatase [Humibacillus xanthopallidus]